MTKADWPQMKIRLDPGLKTLIEKSANDSGRSLNAEICHRLAQSFGDQQPADQEDADLAERVADLERRVAELEHQRSR